MPVNLFFYGLFTDRALLADKGLDPTVLGPACLDGLPPEAIGTKVNRTHAASLGELAAHLGLPAEYIREIESCDLDGLLAVLDPVPASEVAVYAEPYLKASLSAALASETDRYRWTVPRAATSRGRSRR